MDQELLVKEAQALTKCLDQTKVAPRAVMLVVSAETGNWRLWIVPKDDGIDKQEFYRIVAEEISKNEVAQIDVGAVELKKSTNPAVQGLGQMIKSPGISSMYMNNNIVNGVLIPDGVLIRIDL